MGRGPEFPLAPWPITSQAWVVLYNVAHNFTELHKPLHHGKAVTRKESWHEAGHRVENSWAQLGD